MDLAAQNPEKTEETSAADQVARPRSRADPFAKSALSLALKAMSAPAPEFMNDAVHFSVSIVDEVSQVFTPEALAAWKLVRGEMVEEVPEVVSP